ncbi:MAG: hypothetical protein AB4372_26965, partial [Xenococcus sp. (in: cyanobacteria)]
MTSLTKGIFSSLAIVIFLFSPVESINVSNVENSSYDTLSHVQEHSIVLQIASSEKTDKQKNNLENNDKPNISEIIKSIPETIKSIIKSIPETIKYIIKSIPETIKYILDFLGSIMFDLGSILVIVIPVVIFIRLVQKSKATIVLPFEDLREPNQGEQKEKSKIKEIISELLIAELCRIRHIYELAEQSDKQTINQDNPDTFIDAQSLDYEPLNIGNLPIIEFTSGDLAKNMGEVTEIGPIVGKFSLANLIVFVQRIWPNILS